MGKKRLSPLILEVYKDTRKRGSDRRDRGVKQVREAPGVRETIPSREEGREYRPGISIIGRVAILNAREGKRPRSSFKSDGVEVDHSCRIVLSLELDVGGESKRRSYLEQIDETSSRGNKSAAAEESSPMWGA